jgi:hypothetical protein
MQLSVLAVIIVAACAFLNRVRGGGFGGAKLPSRPLFWVTPVIGLLAYSIHSWQIAAAFALGYLIWATPSWGFILAGLGGYKPERSQTVLEAAFEFLGPYWLQTFARMLFVLPGVALVAYLLGDWRFLWAAPIFAAAATLTYALLFENLGSHDWMRAEIVTGALWGLLILSPLVLR